MLKRIRKIEDKPAVGFLTGLVFSVVYSIIVSLPEVSRFLQDSGFFFIHLSPIIMYWWPLIRVLFWSFLGLIIGHLLQTEEEKKRQMEALGRTVAESVRSSRYPWFWIALAKFVLPFAIGGLGVYIIWIFMPDKYAQMYGIMISYFFTPAGRLVMLTGPALGLRFWEIVLVVTFVDVLCSLFIVWNFDITLRIPYLGKLLRKAVNGAHNYLEKWMWLKGIAFVGVVLFVAFPLFGTNAIVGSIVGRIIGMDKINTFISVCIGAFIGAVGVALPIYGISALI